MTATRASKTAVWTSAMATATAMQAAMVTATAMQAVMETAMAMAMASRSPVRFADRSVPKPRCVTATTTTKSVLGTFFDSTEPVIGGSSESIGATTEGYGEGRFVAFVSYATDLEGADGEYRQIYWRDRLTGETLLVSAAPGGEPGNDSSFAPAISADGLVVVFESYADTCSGRSQRRSRMAIPTACGTSSCTTTSMARSPA